MKEDDPRREATEHSGDAKFVDFADTEPVDTPPDRAAPMSPRQAMWLLLLPLGFTFFLTCLWLAMRGVMDLGGMVAIGGPYEIAHPAPGYWWIFPVAIFACILLVFASLAQTAHGGISLVAIFFWPAVFLSLGWNFLEYGFFRFDELAWGWIVCGVLFVPIALIPFYLLKKKTTLRQLLEKMRENANTLWPQFLGIALGIIGGILFFHLVS